MCKSKFNIPKLYCKSQVHANEVPPESQLGLNGEEVLNLNTSSVMSCFSQ